MSNLITALLLVKKYGDLKSFGSLKFSTWILPSIYGSGINFQLGRGPMYKDDDENAIVERGVLLNFSAALGQ